MLFCSQQFTLFFLGVFTVYWSMPWHRARVWLLLGASFVFYASWSKWLASLVCITTVTDYFVARGLEGSTSPRLRKLLLTFSVAGNLGMLCYFKYAGFFLESLGDLLHRLGAEASLPVLKLLAPIGISFYTFEAISYTVDVYRGRIRAERNLAHFLLFILFFPHLIAGPIVRGRDFLPQIRRRKRWSWARLHVGLQFFILGMFKKLAIADRMALFADPVFGHVEGYKSSAVWLAALAYAVQVYCDFSGYSDMAIGCAHLLGYKLAQNFDMPYLAPNIAEFWRRWHISLSTWLRDYLFIPLGGSRQGRWRTYRNLLITMTLGGLWHGASWPCVVFGVLQGLWLGVHRAFREFCKPHPALDGLLQSLPGRAVCVAGTFVTFTGTLAVFRSPTLGAGLTMLHRMAVPHEGLTTPLPQSSLYYLLGVVVLGHVLAQRDLWKRLLALMPSPVRGLGYAGVMTLALVLAPDVGKAFIYFQF
jgi:alginate O-acetyltransferase complex protein AlgI